MAESKDSCVEPAAGPITQPEAENKSQSVETKKEEKTMKPLVGSPAPDFEANAFFDASLSGLWTLGHYDPNNELFLVSWCQFIKVLTSERISF